MTGTRTYGRRLPDGSIEGATFLPGDYMKDTNGVWWARPPGNHLGCLREHTVTEHEDGTITVSPSILVEGEHRWHGYLERGVWREV